MLVFKVDKQDYAELQRVLRRMDSHLFDATKRAFQKTAMDIQSDVKKNFGPGEDQLKPRTGTFRRAIRFLVKGSNLSNLQASVYVQELIYARIHEFGGTITAKNAYKNVPGGPYLNIPIGDNLTPSGVMRMTAREVFNDDGYLTRQDNHWFVVKPGKFHLDDWMFILLKQVKIKPRLGMRDAVDANVPKLIKRLKTIKLGS